MSARSMARRYAAALFDVVQKSGTADRAERDLKAFVDLVKSHDNLQDVFAAPIAPARKRAVLDALLAASGDMSPEVARLLGLLADRDRLASLDEVAHAFDERLMQLRRIVPAEVTTAVPLTDSRRAALAQALGRATGSDVTMSEKVDPAIIGGVVARVGSMVFDGSVTRQLERLRDRLRADV